MMVPDERLRALTERLAALADAPVSEHPDALDEVHAALVAELEGVPGRPADQRERRGGS